MGNEYIFFETDLRDRFMQALSDRGLACHTRADAIEGCIVELIAEPDDDVLASVEAVYEALMTEQMLRAESRPDWISHQVAGVTITRADGNACVVRLPAPVARTLMERFTPEEAQALVAAIAHSLEHPVDGPLCHKA